MFFTIAAAVTVGIIAAVYILKYRKIALIIGGIGLASIIILVLVAWWRDYTYEVPVQVTPITQQESSPPPIQPPEVPRFTICDQIMLEAPESDREKVRDNALAVGLIKNNCLMVIKAVFADFDGDGSDELAFTSSGAGCGSCHEQELRILKGNEVVFHSGGSDIEIRPNADGRGFSMKTPIRNDTDPWCCPSEGLVMIFSIRAGGTGLDTFEKTGEFTEAYNN